MHLVEYSSEWYDRVLEAAEQFPQKTELLHKPFVDWYYTGNVWCKLHLLTDETEKVLGTIGVERMPFRYGDRQLILGNGTQYYVLKRRAGHGRPLFQKWMDSCDFGVTFGGSPDSHGIYRKNEWDYFHGPREYYLNRRLTPYPGEAAWRVVAKKLLRNLPMAPIEKCLSRIPDELLADLEVREETTYSEEMIPQESPFTLRFSPTLEYLRWRYATGLSFVRYRIFRILKSGRQTVGYVVLNQLRDRILVSHCDGTNEESTACGVFLSLLEISREGDRAPEVLLASSNVKMQEAFKLFGFKATDSERPFTIGSLKRPTGIAPDTSSWLINYDWGDNGLRVPFLDQD